jgi:hypothetical protein
VVVLVVVPLEKLATEAQAVFIATGWYFIVLNWLSENGLSLETCGRLCDLVTPNEINNCETECDVMEGPRSLW